jgi:polyisoprenoid-binding protein YceI
LPHGSVNAGVGPSTSSVTFKSKRIISSGGKLQVIGNLTIHGATRARRRIVNCAVECAESMFQVDVCAKADRLAKTIIARTITIRWVIFGMTILLSLISQFP